MFFSLEITNKSVFYLQLKRKKREKIGCKIILKFFKLIQFFMCLSKGFAFNFFP